MKTEIIFSFDTEDFTSPRNADVVIRLANIMTEEGITGHFGVVGLLAKQFQAWDRTDVVEALKPHLIGTHSYQHTVHPTMTEMCDLDDDREATVRMQEREQKSLDILKETFGDRPILFAVPPGADVTYQAQQFYSSKGIPFYLGGFINDDENTLIDYCGMVQIPYTDALEYLFFGGDNGEPRPDIEKKMDQWSKCRRIILFHHPNKAFKTVFWDLLNYNQRNIREFGDWIDAPDRMPEETEAFFEWFRAFIRRLKQDPRFIITDFPHILEERRQHLAPAITQETLPALVSELDHDWAPLKSAAYCVSDVFFAAASFLQGKSSYMPQMTVKGFLQAPHGVKTAVTVSADAVRREALKISLDDYIPSDFILDGQRIGAADMLFAMASVLAGKGPQIQLTPRPQTIDVSELKMLSKLKLKDMWLFAADFEDRYLSERLRMLAWTWRKYGI